MSIRAINWAFEQDCHSYSAKLVLVKLADNANDDGVCWPSMDYLARHCQCSRRSIIRVIKRLEGLQLLDIQHRTKDGVNLPNVYHLRLPIKSMVTPSHYQGQSVTGVVTPEAGGSDTVSHKPLKRIIIKSESEEKGIKTIAQERNEKTDKEIQKRKALLRAQSEALLRSGGRAGYKDDQAKKVNTASLASGIECQDNRSSYVEPKTRE